MFVMGGERVQRTGSKIATMAGNPEFRHELDAAMSIAEPPEYVSRLDKLQERFKHTVSVISDQLRTFNCYAYALDIWQHPDFIELVEATGKTAIVNSGFIEAEIARGGFTEIALEAATVGDILIYFGDGTPKHAGKIATVGAVKVIHSKWGPSETHAHGIWEVPQSYGNELRCFKAVDPEAILDRLYSEQEGQDF
jgi:hypothetical protein